MKFTVYSYCGPLDGLAKAGYDHDTEYDEDIHEAAKKIFEEGLNVMLWRHSEGRVILAVDTKRFQQR